MQESGIKGYEVALWMGAFVPARTPADIVEHLHRELAAALAEREVKETLAASGIEAESNTPARFASYVASEIEKWRKVITMAGIKAE